MHAFPAGEMLADVIRSAESMFETVSIDQFVIMPNHVHAVVRPLRPQIIELEDILRTWKGASSARMSLQGRTSGSLWQRESFDRIIRDEQHLYRVIQYIGRNPRLAKLRPNEAVTWMNPEWDALGWRFGRDDE